MELLAPKEYIEYIEKHRAYLQENSEKLAIYEGELMPQVKKVLKDSISEQYYKKIESRVIPINVLPRIIDKMSKAYLHSPERKVQNSSDQKILNEAVDYMDMDVNMNIADEFSNLFKAYAIDLFEDKGEPRMDILPYDRFLVMNRDKKNRMKVTDFIKFMGKVKHNETELELFWVYTDEFFLPVLSNGEVYTPDLDGNDGINPFGRIPFVYGNRSKQRIIPRQDTDIVQLTKVIPVTLSDLGGAIMFQCFAVVYGIDIKAENLIITPNAFWSFRSDPNGSNQPKIGTIKPEVDVDKVLSFIKSTFSLWLETKGIRVGALGDSDGAITSSGISKIIDESDTSDIINRSKRYFEKEEKDFWDLFKIKNNYWVKNVPNYKLKMVSEDFAPEIFTEDYSLDKAVENVMDSEENSNTEGLQSTDQEGNSSRDN